MDMDFYKFGSGKETLVIIPGLSAQSVMESKALVEEAYKQLSDYCTMYLIDRRRELPESYTMEEMAEDTAEKIAELGLERACIFGASQGGMIGLKIAINHPELTGRLILASSTARVTAERFKTIAKWIELAEAKDAKALCLSMGEDIYPKEVFEASRKLLCDMAESITDEELKRFIILAEAIKGFDVTAELQRISCPVFIIGDSEDRVFGGDAGEELAELLKGKPGVEMHMYEGFGHAAYDTAPDCRERILSFLKKTGR